MMGYTHAIAGAGGAVIIAALTGDGTPALYLAASIAGAVGGVAIDIDSKDQRENPKVTDAGRTRLAVLGMVALGVVLDLICKIGVLSEIISRPDYAIGGLIAFIVLMIIGRFTEHRTFSHSLLFSILCSGCVYCICPRTLYYCITGCLLHLALDMLNYPFSNHGVWLLYPLKTGKGIALKVCKSGRTGNKVAFFIGLGIYVAASVFYIWHIKDFTKSIAPGIIIIYMIVVMNLVRVKSEKEQRHIMHMRG